MQIINRKTLDPIRAETSFKTKGEITAQIIGTDSLPKKTIKQPMRSFTRNPFWWFHGSMDNDSSPAMITRTGSISSSIGGTPSFATFRLDINEQSNVEYGLQVGGSDTPMEIADFDLGDYIPDGSGAGEILRKAEVHTLKNRGINIARGFENQSGSIININEMGLVGHRSGASSAWLLLARDVLEETLPVAHQELVNLTMSVDLVEGNFNFHDFWRYLLGYQTAANRFLTIDSNGTERDSQPNTTLRVESGVGEVNGIRLGTSDKEVDFADIDLDEKILHGTGTGELTHGETVLGDFLLVNAEGYCEFEVSRSFTNNSGADIVIEEMGLFGFGQASSTHIMHDRYVLPTPITIPNGASRTARWRFLYSI